MYHGDPENLIKKKKLFEKDLKKCLTNKLRCGKINKSPNEGNFKKATQDLEN